jgi:hypothetical protein
LTWVTRDVKPSPSDLSAGQLNNKNSYFIIN